jgi:hypothetical protein
MASRQEAFRSVGAELRAFLEGFLGTGAEVEAGIDAGDLSRGAAGVAGKAIPQAGIDAFLSHFVLAIEFRDLAQAGQGSGLTTLSLPAAVQTVARSHPFRYGAKSHRADFPLPKGSSLARSITEQDFLITPPAFFEDGKETIWLQILNLDAKADTPLGSVRIILGETFKREYPDIFQPSFGGAQSLRGSGFPARLFFSPNAVIETPLGAFKTRPKALVGAEINAFPPVGSYPSLLEPVGLDRVERLRSNKNKKATLAADGEPDATITALAHPIDANLVSGTDAFAAVEAKIQAA